MSQKVEDPASKHEERNIGQPLGESPQLYRNDETILLDIGGAKAEGITTNLKLAKDGHVSSQ
jgi:hypothetical protein